MEDKKGGDQMVEISRYLPFWEHLSPQEQELVMQNITTVHYRKGERVHSGDDDCLGMLILKSGRLCTYLLSEEGREITLFRLSAGETCIFSASCVISQITFDVLISAEEDTEALLLGLPVFSQLKRENIYVENFSLQLAVERFSDVMWAMQQLLFLGMDQRLAIFLLDEASKTGSPIVKITHEKIAKHTGSAREVVTRMLKRFAEDGLVSLARGTVRLENIAGLKRLLPPN